MPEPSGTGTTTPPATPPPAGPAGGDAGSGAGAPGGQTPEQTAQDQRLAREAATWRTKFREAETQISTLTQQIEELKKAPSPGGDTSELATLKREFGNLQKTVKDANDRATKAEEAQRQEKLDNSLLKAIADAKLQDPEDAFLLAKAKGKARVAADGKTVFVITENGEEREVVISADAIKQFKLVPDRFFPADGVAGAGSKGGSRPPAAGGFDYERGLRDPAYHAAHEKEMKEEFRRRNSG